MESYGPPIVIPMDDFDMGISDSVWIVLLAVLIVLAGCLIAFIMTTKINKGNQKLQERNNRIQNCKELAALVGEYCAAALEWRSLVEADRIQYEHQNQELTRILDRKIEKSVLNEFIFQEKARSKFFTLQIRLKESEQLQALHDRLSAIQSNMNNMSMTLDEFNQKIIECLEETASVLEEYKRIDIT